MKDIALIGTIIIALLGGYYLKSNHREEIECMKARMEFEKAELAAYYNNELAGLGPALHRDALERTKYAAEASMRSMANAVLFHEDCFSTTEIGRAQKLSDNP
ncbi:hypothetical protein FDA94_24700 [Herbidospora galbida]|uniref:Uncharacterized protein n=1 Tax=Herbidospora galbida TaxID=2575442 RepID=A0A4U3MD66_9ACTN|nr:hypothetical protein [Herbidospora galbida]TKK85596.1 hypothetical protein FDA94_24700 [Herbidospora galbida]